MDSIFPDAGIHYRAIHAPLLQHSACLLIIATETLATLLCWIGVWRM